MAARPSSALILALALCACGAPGGWRVADGLIVDPDGRAVVLRGVNLSEAQKRAPYLDFQQAADYARIHDDFGMNAVRFVLPWAAVEPTRGQYDDDYLAAVVTRLGWAADAGLEVVVDMHQDVWGEGFGFDGAPRWTCDEARYGAFQPQMPWALDYTDPNVMGCFDSLFTDADLQDRFVAAWGHVARALAGAPAVLGFDPLNEPYWGSYSLFDFEADRLAPLYERVVGAVRAEAPHWLAFVEPAASRNFGIATGLPRFPYDDVVYAPHSYDTQTEGGADFDPSHRQAILDNLTALEVEATAHHAALWIGEYGVPSTRGGIADYMAAQYDGMGAVAAGGMYWEYGRDDQYGLLDPDGSDKAVLLDAVVRPAPERVAGKPIAYTFDAATAAFTFTYSPDRAVHAPTEITLPARTYPAGFQVDCGGCTYLLRAGGITITAAAADDPATVTVRPAP
jgi:endoglycosylceramidase